MILNTKKLLLGIFVLVNNFDLAQFIKSLYDNVLICEVVFARSSTVCLGNIHQFYKHNPLTDFKSSEL